MQALHLPYSEKSIGNFFRAILIPFTLLTSGITRCQDTLILTDGSEMHVRVLEVGPKLMSYKKSGSKDSSTYHMDLSRVFLAIYKNGRRETFYTENHKISNLHPKNEYTRGRGDPKLTKSGIDAYIQEFKQFTDSKNKYKYATASINVYENNKFFGRFEVSVQQRIDGKNNWGDPGWSYYTKNSISIQPISAPLINFLSQKYENSKGSGYGWAIPPGFFEPGLKDCTVAFLKQKNLNKEVLGFGGITIEKISLESCDTIENRILSIVLIWLEKNFNSP